MSEGFIQIRRGLLEHTERGAIGFLELGIYLQIHLQANYETGVWMGSAAKLAATAPRGADGRSIRRSLENLERAGYIKRFTTRGKRGNYPVILNKYEPQSGAMKGNRLNAELTTDWRNPVYESRHEVSMRTPGERHEHASILKEERKREVKTPSVSEGETCASLQGETQEGAFGLFWESYPRKQGKETALRAWRKIPVGEYPTVMSGLQRWRGSEQWTRGVIPHAATWLNARRWQDEDIPQSGENTNGSNNSGESFTERNQRKSQETLDRVRRNLDAVDEKVGKLLPEPHRYGPGNSDVCGSTAGSESGAPRKWVS
jgi:hypothetical protein